MQLYSIEKLELKVERGFGESNGALGEGGDRQLSRNGGDDQENIGGEEEAERVAGLQHKLSCIIAFRGAVRDRRKALASPMGVA